MSFQVATSRSVRARPVHALVPRFAPWLALALALAGTPVAHARNDSFEQPIREAMHKKRMREIVGELPMRFGSASANGADLIPGDVVVQGEASIVGDDPRKHVHPSDEQVCLHAFEDAISQLVAQAHRAGAAAVVGIVSDFKGQLFDDPESYDCHAGLAKSYVTLKGQLARGFGADGAPEPAASSGTQGQ